MNRRISPVSGSISQTFSMISTGVWAESVVTGCVSQRWQSFQTLLFWFTFKASVTAHDTVDQCSHCYNMWSEQLNFKCTPQSIILICFFLMTQGEMQNKYIKT